jgi:serine/threonine protein kinase
MAPEIVNRKEFCGPPVDMWALGVLLYFMLYGVYPFKATNERELYRRIRAVKYTTPKGPSKAARDLIADLLSYRSDERPTA